MPTVQFISKITPLMKIKKISKTPGAVTTNTIISNSAQQLKRDSFNIQTPAIKRLPDLQMSIRKVISDEDLRKIYEIDLGAFADISPVPNDFTSYKHKIASLDSYIVKDNNGRVTGYYQIDPTEEAYIYISSIGIPKELRGTKTSFYTLMAIKDNIKQLAKEKNAKAISLHVDAKNESLVKMYKKFGFEIKHEESNYYTNGNSAYYMEIQLARPQKIIIESKVENVSSYNNRQDFSKTIDWIKTYLRKSESAVGPAKISDEQINSLIFRLRTPEKAFFAKKLILAKNAAGQPRLKIEDIIEILTTTIESQRIKNKTLLIGNNKFAQKIDDLSEKLGKDLYPEYLKSSEGHDVAPQKIENLYKYLLDNKALLQKQGKYKYTNKDILSLFDTQIINTMGLVDNEVIKFAVPLKFEDFKEFISDTSDLVRRLDEDTYLKLKNKLSACTTPGIQYENIQNIIKLMKTTQKKSMVTEFIDLLEPLKATKDQMKIANEIFTSNKNYDEQTKEFLEKFNVSSEEKNEILKFLQTAKLNEKITIDNGSGKKRIKKEYLGQLAQQIETHINVPSNNAKKADFFQAHIFRLLGLEEKPELKSVLNFDKHYLAELFFAIHKENFLYEFKKLINLIEANPNKPLSEIRELLPHNQETGKLFGANNLNYEKWINFDKNLYQNFSCEINLEEATKNVGSNLVEELNSKLFKSVDQEQIDKINNALKDAGYKVEPDKIHKDDKSLSRKELKEIADIFKTALKENSNYWDKKLPDEKSENLKNEVMDYLLITYRKNVSDLDSIKNTKLDLQIRLSNDNDVGRNLFLGNHVSCCTAIGHSRSPVAVQHLLNSYIRAIEIIDKTGKSYGNSMCYLAKVDGKLSFIVDSFEVDGKLAGNQDITNAIIEYAKQVTEEIEQPDIPIYFGPYHKGINISKLTETEGCTIEIIGRADEHTYIDSIGGINDINIPHAEQKLLKVA